LRARASQFGASLRLVVACLLQVAQGDYLVLVQVCRAHQRGMRRLVRGARLGEIARELRRIARAQQREWLTRPHAIARLGEQRDDAPDHRAQDAHGVIFIRNDLCGKRRDRALTHQPHGVDAKRGILWRVGGYADLALRRQGRCVRRLLGGAARYEQARQHQHADTPRRI
jgi:hypothetical protein